MVRLFVAVDIPETLKTKIVSLEKRFEEPGLGVVAPQNLHITLQFLGEVSGDRTPQIAEALKTVKMNPFAVNISGVGVFPSDDYIRVVWLGCDGPLPELASKVQACLHPLAFMPDKPFASHLTIARIKFKTKNLRDNLVNLQNAVVGKMTVDKFSLKKSTLTPGGPIYEDVAVFELSG